MYIILFIFGLGFLVGIINKQRKKFMFVTERLTTFSIFLLLFFLGVSVGTNEIIIQNLHSIGLNALVITLGSVGGSLIFAALLYHFMFKKGLP